MRRSLKSKRILITALAQDKQSGTRYSADGRTLEATGTPPLLLEPVQATVKFGGAKPAKVTPCDHYGVPLAQRLRSARMAALPSMGPRMPTTTKCGGEACGADFAGADSAAGAHPRAGSRKPSRDGPHRRKGSVPLAEGGAPLPKVVPFSKGNAPFSKVVPPFPR
jgi:hypothetical protein